MHHTKRRTSGERSTGDEHSKRPVRGLPIQGGSWPVKNYKKQLIKPLIDPKSIRRKKLSMRLLPPDEYSGMSAEMHKKQRFYEGGTP